MKEICTTMNSLGMSFILWGAALITADILSSIIVAETFAEGVALLAFAGPVGWVIGGAVALGAGLVLGGYAIYDSASKKKLPIYTKQEAIEIATTKMELGKNLFMWLKIALIEFASEAINWNIIKAFI